MTDEAELELLRELIAVCAAASTLVDEEACAAQLEEGGLSLDGLPGHVLAQAVATLIRAGFTPQFDAADQVTLSSARVSVFLYHASPPRLEQAAAAAVLDFRDLMADGQVTAAVGRFGAVAVGFALAGAPGEAYAALVQHALLAAADVRVGTVFALDERGLLLATLLADEVSKFTGAGTRTVGAQRSVREVLRGKPELVDAACALDAPSHDGQPVSKQPARAMRGARTAPGSGKSRSR
jgi:hypothetical protein